MSPFTDLQTDDTEMLHYETDQLCNRDSGNISIWDKRGPLVLVQRHRVKATVYLFYDNQIVSTYL